MSATLCQSELFKVQDTAHWPLIRCRTVRDAILASMRVQNPEARHILDRLEAFRVYATDEENLSSHDGHGFPRSQVKQLIALTKMIKGLEQKVVTR